MYCHMFFGSVFRFQQAFDLVLTYRTNLSVYVLLSKSMDSCIVVKVAEMVCLLARTRNRVPTGVSKVNSPTFSDLQANFPRLTATAYLMPETVQWCTYPLCCKKHTPY